MNKPIQLLLIEDDEVDAEAIERACRHLNVNCEIVRFHDGREALDALRGAFGAGLLARPYMIVLDLNLPRLDGIAFLDDLRADPSGAAASFLCSPPRRVRRTRRRRMIAGWPVT